MIKQNKGKTILSSLLIFLPALIGFSLIEYLPDRIPIHWGIDGSPDSWGSPLIVMILLPLILLVLHWATLLIVSRNNTARTQSKKVLDLTFWLCPLISFCVCGVIFSTALELTPSLNDTNIPLCLLIAIPLIIVGNLLPKCTQNRTIGIKIKWTLESEENWNRTHRLAGKVWVICGICLVGAGFLPSETISVVMPLIFLPCVLIPCMYSYLYSRKQHKNGNTETTQPQARSRQERIALACAGCFFAVVLAVVLLFCFSGDFTVELRDNDFTVTADFHTDLTVAYDSINAIEYRETDTHGKRVIGFGSARLRMGEFRNDEFGLYTRYSYTKCTACIVLTLDARTIVLSGKDAAQTKDLYLALLERIPATA